MGYDEDTFQFTNTGERIPFELLIRQEGEGNTKTKYLQAYELFQQKHSYETIAKMLGYKSKSSVSDLIKKGEQTGWNK